MATVKTNPGLESNLTIIGESVRVRGNLSGDEDLHVLGRVDGRIDLQRTLVVVPSGIVKAEVTVKNAIVSGVVVGNIHASESVEITPEGRMVGDIHAPRVIIVDGASFKGSVDMGDIANMPVRKEGSERARPADALSARSALSTSQRMASKPTPAPTPVSRSSPPSPAPFASRGMAAPPAVSAAGATAAAGADEENDDDTEYENNDDDLDLSSDPPAAKGLPQKAQKARVIVKRK